MSDVQDSNSQPQTPPPPAPQPGPTVDELQARMAELERQSEGRLRDLQDERRKRQEYEARMSQTAPAPSPVNQDVSQDELGKVLNPYIAPLKNKLQETEARLAQYEEAEVFNTLAKREGKTPEAIRSDTAFQERLVATARKWGLAGANSQIALRAYDLMKREERDIAEAEKARVAATSQAASLPSGTPAAPVAQQKQYTNEEFVAMNPSIYEKMTADGSKFIKKSDGSFVYTPAK